MIERKTFGKLKPVIQPPNLIAIQTESFDEFLQRGVPPAERDEKKGLQAIFREIFPIVGGALDENGEERFTLDFVNYRFEEPKISFVQALKDDATYSGRLFATFSLKCDNGEITTKEILLGEIPLMTPDGHFVCNGAERVVISQLHRSAGVCVEDANKDGKEPSYSVRIIPERGSWIEISFDIKDVMWVVLDRKHKTRKFNVSTLLRALGYSTDEQLLKLYYEFKEITFDGSKSSDNVIAFNEKLDDDAISILRFADDVIDVNSHTVHARRYEQVSRPLLEQIKSAFGGRPVKVFDVTFDGGLFLKSLIVDDTRNQESALTSIFGKLRPGDPVTEANAKTSFHNLFFDPRRYDLSLVGRHVINKKLNLQGKVPESLRTLSEDGIEVVEAVRKLLNVRQKREDPDDIDHLGSRRIRTAGELIANQCRLALARAQTNISQHMKEVQAGQTPSLEKLVGNRVLSSAMQDFFGRSQLSQFMDQTNPLSSLAHMRRLSALGPGGLSRDRAGLEVRDIHMSHYGRICPIETPEGPNIGLISSLGLYAKINKFGFVETPYLRVENGKVTSEVVHMSADDEEKYVIAQANCALDKNNRFVDETVSARHKAEFVQAKAKDVQFMDVSPLQVVSIAAGLIPFLEHDDANRALMGANMMRQAVPLLRPDRPFVATGLEGRAACDSLVTVQSKADGIVAYVDALKIVVSDDGKYPKTPKAREQNHTIVYELQKFRRTNASTCFNQKPIVKFGQTVKAGQVLADGPATKDGELALGKNLTCVYMPWNGYNFEDAILLSERCVRDDVFTSLHIQVHSCETRDTKQGPEQITRDITQAGEDRLRNLTIDGVVRVGTEVTHGDYLVGKVTPKSDREKSPEENLIRAIFNQKSNDFRDTSLKVPPGSGGIVMDVITTSKTDGIHGFSRSSSQDMSLYDDDAIEHVVDDVIPGGMEVATTDDDAGEAKASLLTTNDLRGGATVKEDTEKQLRSLNKELKVALSVAIKGQKAPVDIIHATTGDIIVAKNHKIVDTAITKIVNARNDFMMDACELKDKIRNIIDGFEPRYNQYEGDIDTFNALYGESASAGTIKSVRVLIADKKNLSVGDKLAGRHGNKGVVSRILKDCDMPYLPDGTPVDIVLNPLGVPSRMNLGQLFEAYLGAACKELGIYAATPVFDGVSEEDIDRLLAEARASQEKRALTEPGVVPYINVDGKSVVYDGRTGEPFDQRVVVGQTYFLKLHHLVTDKIHARAVGPYSLVTAQPLGGKAQFGGQRMGEMEVWALEAYGVSYALQELLTVKSDDVVGRQRIYESIVKGTPSLEAGTPASFSVLLHELRGLCLDMTGLELGHARPNSDGIEDILN